MIPSHGVLRLPGIQQRHTEGLAPEAVHPDSVVASSPGSGATQDDGIVLGRTEYIRIRARLRDGLDIGELVCAVEELYAVAAVPVAGNDHASAVQLRAGGHGAFVVQTAEALEGAGRGVVGLHGPESPDAEVLFHASRQQHLPGGERQGKGEVGSVGHVHQVPLAVAEILGGGCGHEAVRVASDGREFTIQTEKGMAATCHLHIWQALHLKLKYRAGSTVRCRRRPGHRTRQSSNASSQKSENEVGADMSHLYLRRK